MLSGEAVTSIPVEEVQDVKGLKQRLNQLHGLPPRFRQRILFHGETLEDTVMLNSPMNLDLVLLTFADVSQRQVEDLAYAAEQGSVSEVGSFGAVFVQYYTYMKNPIKTMPAPWLRCTRSCKPCFGLSRHHRT